jgi:glycosyltransferase involved in cell wall biosynthesis
VANFSFGLAENVVEVNLKNMPTELTIAICTYNGAARLPACLGALARQKIPADLSWEVLIVDNASTDNTAGVARELLASLVLPGRVVTEGRKGKINAIRTAAVEAKGEILSYLDDDNIVAEDWAGQCVAFMRSHPRAGIIGPKIDPIFQEPASVPVDFQKRFSHALALRDFGPEPTILAPPTSDGPPGAGLTGRTALLRMILVDIGCRLRGPTGGRVADEHGFLRHLRPTTGRGPADGEDSEISLISRRLGWELWYVPAMKMGHIIPASRLTNEYLDRLIANGAGAGPWLEYLRGDGKPHARLFYFGKWAWYKLLSFKMALLYQMRSKTDEAPKLRFWTEMCLNTASGYWELATKYPFAKFESALASAQNGQSK